MAAVYAPVPEIPDYPDSYAKVHPDRVKSFPPGLKELDINPKRIDVNKRDDGWRHELEHDTESVFWLLLYWAMVAQPVDCAKETIDSFSWSGLLGDSEKRQSLVEILSKRTPSNLTHSFYEPLQPLIEDLAGLLVIDRHWLSESDPPDPRSDLYYLNEAFQRLIIKFMIDNKDEEFMHRRVKTIFRKVEGMQHSNAKSITDSQTFDVTKRLVSSSVKPPVDAANPLVISSVIPPVCGSMNFCLFLLLCLWVYLQAMDDSEMADFSDMGNDTATGDDTDTGDDTEMVDVQ
jgi:hypothetical protein